jgi:threonine aldolase
MELIDLRSDTVTRPTQGMRQAMFDAPLGDACFDDDPSVHRLQSAAAELLGKEAAIFVPTGTMSNQIGIATHLQTGDAVLLERWAHIAQWEGAGVAVHSGAQLVGVPSKDGLPSIEDLQAACFPDHPKAPRIALLAMENTHNGAGGIPHGSEAIGQRAAWARKKGFDVHMDGARLFNASSATGEGAADLVRSCDTVSICLSKGLGAPVGSVLLGPRSLMDRANRLRHRCGGGWRQAGMLAAAGLYALSHHVERLAEDHAHAASIAEALAGTGFARAHHEVRTNIVCYQVDPDWGSAAKFTEILAEKGVLVVHTSAQKGRLVTHLDVDSDMVLEVNRILSEL